MHFRKKVRTIPKLKISKKSAKLKLRSLLKS